jgi:hypothetical protein
MMRTSTFLCLCAIVLGCRDEYDPGKYLSAEEKDHVVTSVIRYIAKLPPGASDSTKFDKRYDSYYQKKISEARLERYYEDPSKSYFLISQPAPSLTEKRHATGGWFVMDESDEITEYFESFRTWKMAGDTLTRRSYILFDKMVEGESLEPYLTKNSKGVEFIEFPDDNVYFDEGKRVWKVRD